jgi:hypothetical protein
MKLVRIWSLVRLIEKNAKLCMSHEILDTLFTVYHTNAFDWLLLRLPVRSFRLTSSSRRWGCHTRHVESIQVNVVLPVTIDSCPFVAGLMAWPNSISLSCFDCQKFPGCYLICHEALLGLVTLLTCGCRRSWIQLFPCSSRSIVSLQLYPPWLWVLYEIHASSNRV